MPDVNALMREMPSVEEVVLSSPDALSARLDGAIAPFVIRGLIADWPLVAAGERSPRDAREYLLHRHRNRKFTVSVGTPGSGGRVFYDNSMAVNFRTVTAMLPEIFTQMDASEGQDDAPLIYIASTDVDAYFDGVHADNHVALSGKSCLERIWIGNRTRIAAHNDLPHNLACVAVGARRFTLFPPDQFENLYLGPLDNTPAGRTISMVDFHAPNLERFPDFTKAVACGQVADLRAGDALFVPALWWHHVEATADFNILVNYWWRDTPVWMGQPQDALHHALMAIRDLPPAQRRHWKAMFDHYVFESDKADMSYIPADARGVLGPMTPETAARIRGYLLRQLNQ